MGFDESEASVPPSLTVIPAHPARLDVRSSRPPFCAGCIAAGRGNVTPALAIFPTESGRCGIFLNLRRIPGTLASHPRRAARGDFGNQRGEAADRVKDKAGIAG